MAWQAVAMAAASAYAGYKNSQAKNETRDTSYNSTTTRTPTDFYNPAYSEEQNSANNMGGVGYSQLMSGVMNLINKDLGSSLGISLPTDGSTSLPGGDVFGNMNTYQGQGGPVAYGSGPSGNAQTKAEYDNELTAALREIFQNPYGDIDSVWGGGDPWGDLQGYARGRGGGGGGHAGWASPEWQLY